MQSFLQGLANGGISKLKQCKQDDQSHEKQGGTLPSDQSTYYVLRPCLYNTGLNLKWCRKSGKGLVS
ncbi:hypothetical protein SLEP1_g16151 [Rubroshorea leprosula]|uniref:Uncharacterized protein n=1 Tax=Rubroshorea leprosula TaxID=152421 RepID=A0AAV5IXL4_9ROSI|nr:hypothetical protein SLEP1_g16151 [Rubroshorea leprosula]